MDTNTLKLSIPMVAARPAYVGSEGRELKAPKGAGFTNG